MVQVAKNRYASQQYHDFIGFQVSKPLLERTFSYCVRIGVKDVMAHEDSPSVPIALRSAGMIPELTQVALRTHQKDIMREEPDFAKKKFLYRLSRSDYERDGERITRRRDS